VGGRGPCHAKDGQQESGDAEAPHTPSVLWATR
jgi:hypothetical protein